MTAAELAEKLERLDALFVDLYRYAESCTVTGMNAQQAGQALRSIKNTIGNRHNVIPQAAALLRSMGEAPVETTKVTDADVNAALAHFDSLRWPDDPSYEELNQRIEQLEDALDKDAARFAHIKDWLQSNKAADVMRRVDMANHVWHCEVEARAALQGEGQ